MIYLAETVVSIDSVAVPPGSVGHAGCLRTSTGTAECVVMLGAGHFSPLVCLLAQHS